MIPDWATGPFVHVNWIELRLSAVALKSVGASGARPITTIAVLDTVDKPSLSVTVRDTVKVPGVEYT